MRYLVIGAGGIGCSIGAYLSAGGLDVTLLARGAQLVAIRKNGLTAKTVRKGELHCPINAVAAEDDFPKSDVIFVCVKGYSLMEIVPVIAKAAHENTVVIPILNTLRAGESLGASLPGIPVLDGCVYTSAFVTAPGEVTQPSPLFRIVFGVRKGHPSDEGVLKGIVSDLEACGIDALCSEYIERDMFKKFTFISAFAATDSYFDVSAGAIQQDGPERELFLALLGEMQSIVQAKGLEMDTDLAADSVRILDGFGPDVTSSLHKDVKAGKNTEKKELIFDVVDMAKALQVSVPQYTQIASHFGYAAN